MTHMLFERLTCDLLNELNKFLTKEMEEERRHMFFSKPVSAYAIKSIRKDDLYYTLLKPSEELSKFDDGTWVRVTVGGYSQYGSLWFTEDERPYLLTGEPVSDNVLQIVEADGLQLLEMQKQAFSTLLNGTSTHVRKMREILFNNYREEGSSSFHEISFYDSRVARNQSQKKSVERALAACNNNSFFLIHGPPGTGKTTVITEIVRHLIDLDRKVLVTSHTNVAVNNVMENLANSMPSLRFQMVRLGPRAKVSKVLKDLVPTHEDELIKLVLSRIVGATLSKLSILVLNNKLSFDNQFFDTVIIDESSMATIPLTLAGILQGKSFILVGDHKQLPPITKTNYPETCPEHWKCGKLCESLFRLLIEAYPEKSQILDLQFRSHPYIVGFSQKHIYNGRIRSADECFAKKIELQHIDREQIPGTINSNPICYVNMCFERNPVEWFPKGYENGKRRKIPSCFNELEATVAIKIRHDLIKAGVHPEKIWIITPFRLQREIIRKAIRKIYGSVPEDTVISIYENLVASTVDAIQGKENDVIIYSLTWVPSETRIRNLHPALRDERRLNVALTRARKKLIIIGQLDWISVARSSGQNIYGMLENYMESYNAEVVAPDISDDDDFLKVVRFCFKRKKNEAMQEIFIKDVRSAVRRIRRDIGLFHRPTTWLIKNENDFQEFTESELWDELTYVSKQKIYDLRIRGKIFEIVYTYNQEKAKKEIFIKIYEGYGNIRTEPLNFE